MRKFQFSYLITCASKLSQERSGSLKFPFAIWNIGTELPDVSNSKYVILHGTAMY